MVVLGIMTHSWAGIPLPIVGGTVVWMIGVPGGFARRVVVWCLHLRVSVALVGSAYAVLV